jgi:hypothetical protein
MNVRLFAALAVACAAASAQTVCPPTQEFSPCDLVFDLPGTPTDQPLDLQAEFRSPEANTVLARAFWDGGTRWVIRYTPAEAGKHVYRLTGSIAEFSGKHGEITAIDNPAHPGWLRPANLHHFALVDGINYTPYLYMGAVVPGFAAMDAARWNALVDQRAAQHFNHLAVTLVDSSAAASFRTPEFFQAAEEKIAYANRHGIMIDLAFFGPGLMTKLLPSSDRREWFTYALSRLSAFDVVWDGIEAWENEPDGPALLMEIAGYLKAMDPYRHLATTRTLVTSAALPDRSWMQIRSYQTSDDAISGIEQQLYQYPAINNFSAGDSTADAFRHHLWNSTMDGQYPAAVVPDEASATAMKAWYELLSSTRHWELEPFFDVENGRGLQLEGVEYLIYVEHPGPVTLTVEKHRYDAEWIDPATGERTKIKKNPCKDETCTASPPDTGHDWILHVSREGTKEDMLKSFRFASREQDLQLQVVETNPDKVPIEVTGPTSRTVTLSSPLEFSVKLTRQSKALEHMTWLWRAEVGASGRGYRVIGTTAGGSFRIPSDISDEYPAGLHIRIFAMNGLGKVYSIDRNYILNQ